MRKRKCSISLLLAALVACASGPVLNVSAQTYPVRPVRVVVGFAPGGSGDVVARLVSQKLSENIGQPVIVENRAGASGSIANARVASAVADGHTLLLISASATILPALRANLPYNLESDFAPVSLVVGGPYLLVVHPSVAARDVKELISLARAQPGKLTYGTSGVGTAPHLVGELLNSMAGIQMLHVPYKGSAESTVGTAAGQVHVNFPSIPPALPLIEAGKLRAIAVTSAKRAALVPSIPTIAESGLAGYDRSAWYGVLAPAGVPQSIIVRLSAVLSKQFNTPETMALLGKQGLEPLTNTPAQFAMFMKNEIAQNAKLIRSTGIKPE